ncbi:MAG: hypothetical protein J6C82_07755 [Clostridia bacterium]|nr:hypothetical protein [Clostridia bacterium]
MKKSIKHMAICMLLIVLSVFQLDCGTVLEAATVTKNSKTYEIAVVFDNSGSMYKNQAWCRAKYAMEIFASMMNYENGDVLKIFPMWPVTTDGTKPASGGSYEGIEIRSSSDINKISNLYTVVASNTPFAPVTEAYNALLGSGASEKWLIVLTDGEFNEEARGQKATIKLQSRLSELASENIKVQYLGMGAATALKSDESRCFYAKKSSETSLKEDLVSICNTIFQRSALPNNYLSGSALTLDMSMKNLIVFVQGADAKIGSLLAADNTPVKEILNSGQRRYSEIKAGGYENAPVDTTLAGQVVTFGPCPKGSYTLEYSNAASIQVFYEPDVDISLSLTNSDGQPVDYKTGQISAGNYTANYGIIDAVTGEDVTKSPLMGSDVVMSGKLVASDGTETEITSGGTVAINPDDATKIIIKGTYLKDYTISTEDDPASFPAIKVDFPELKGLGLKASTEQPSSWFQTGKESGWKPIRVSATLAGEPLTDEQLSALIPSLTFSKDITYSYKILPGESAFEINIGYDENGSYTKPESGKYKLTASAALTDEYGRDMQDETSMEFEVHGYSAIWRWLKWLIIILILLLITAFILTRKAWPKEMYFVCGKRRGKINISKNMNIVSNAYPNVLSCAAEKSSKLYQKFGKSAGVRITKVTPMFNVVSFKIGSSPTYTKDGKDYVDSSGKTFKGVNLKNNTRIIVEFKGNKPPIDGKISMNGKK